MPRKTSVKTTSDTVKIVCTCCGKQKPQKEYYKSFSRFNKAFERLHVCKNCLWQEFKNIFEESKDLRVAVYRICRYIDAPFIEVAFLSAIDECNINKGENFNLDDKEDALSVFGIYMKNINSLGQYSGYTFESGDKENIELKTESIEQTLAEESMTERDKKNQEDVINMIGYDPFESENFKDRKYLFNRLIDFLDDSTVEDSFKLLTVIEIVKSFNQVDKINELIARMTKDIGNMANNAGGIKTLMGTKKDLLASILNSAKDNGISVNYNNNKSKGAGTLSGIIKKLQEIGLHSSEINAYDVETAEGIRQVADISNESIKKQLIFDENDYATMLSDQRTLINELDKKKSSSEEENRKLKKILKFAEIDYEKYMSEV